MIPVALEPTCLSYDLARDGAAQNIDFETDFPSFMRRVQTLLSNLDSLDIGILVSSAVREQLAEYVPTKAYGNTSLARIASELFHSRIYKLAKVQALLAGDHPVQFDTLSVVDNGVMNHSFYTSWFDMMKLHRNMMLIPWIMKSVEKSIFVADETKLVDSSNWEKPIRLAQDPTIIPSSAEYMVWSLAMRGQTIADIDQIPCRGTGTHSSMWGRAIRTLNDVPRFERELLQQLLATGWIMSLKFLSFDNPYPPAVEPTLEIVEINEGDVSDSLICTLKGRGSRQNGQIVRMDVVKGIAQSLKGAFCSEITLARLQQLSALLQTAAQ